MAKIYTTNKISYYLCYTVEDLSKLFLDKKLHSQTVHKWIKEEGLPIIDNKKPILIYGNSLINFLKDRNKKNKHSINFEEFFCLSCREAHIPHKREVKSLQENSYIKLKALCPKNKKPMYKSYKLDDYSKLKKIFTVVEELRLYDSETPTPKTQIQDNWELPFDESFK